MRKYYHAVILGCTIMLLGMGCAGIGVISQPLTKATAILRPTQGNNVQGTVSFVKEGSVIRVIVDISGLSPGKHGIHIHEYGDCSAPDAVSAGGHYNPANKAHGCPDSKERHLGDLGNIEADRSGKAKSDWIDKRISLSGANSVIGRSVVVKAKPDDCVAQPGGGAGARVACGIIGVVAQPGE